MKCFFALALCSELEFSMDNWFIAKANAPQNTSAVQLVSFFPLFFPLQGKNSFCFLIYISLCFAAISSVAQAGCRHVLPAELKVATSGPI